MHDEPIKQVKWIDAPGGGLLATGSWDKTIKYWDLRSPTAVASVVLPERLYSPSTREYPLNDELTVHHSNGRRLPASGRRYRRSAYSNLQSYPTDKSVQNDS